MEIVETSADEVIRSTRVALGLDVTTSIDDALRAALLRRAAGIHCPCSASTLISSVLESVEHLVPDLEAEQDRLASMIDDLIACGDLLELSQVAVQDSTLTGAWLFAAPPAFVLRPSGSIFLTGVVPDHEMFLPDSLARRVAHQGFTRVIAPLPNEDLATELRELGIHEMSESAWLKTPKAQSAQHLLADMGERLASQPPSGSVEGLQILDSQRSVKFYRGRWVTPQTQTGRFVARRPQAYGAPIWCFVEIERGIPIRLLDLPSRRTRWRGCDIAWHLQMAIDHSRKVPQQYRRVYKQDDIRFDFFSPLPQWAQRRLLTFGRPETPAKCLMSYVLPRVEAATEERFLQERLWLVRSEDSN